MGKVIFLNKQSETYHKENNIKIQNPPELKLVVSKPTIEKPRRSGKKPKRETLGQRIYRSLQERDGEDGNDAG